MRRAEALIERADLQKQVQAVRQHLVNNAKVQEGDAPSEPPEVLLAELERMLSRLEELIRQINHANSVTEISAGVSLSDALARRDVLALRRSAYSELAEAASVGQNRFSRMEVRFVSTVNTAEMRKRADEVAREFRELDTQIQELNWRTELL